MTWGAIGGAAVSVVGGSLLNKGKSSGSSNADASAAGSVQSWQDIQKANDLNRQNATWSQQQNQAANTAALGTNKDNQLWAQGANQTSLDAQNAANRDNADYVLGQNRTNMQTAGGGLTWEQDPTTGAWTQSSSLNPSAQNTLDALRGSYGTAAGNLDTGGGFNVNSDYMNAMKAQLQPGLDQTRNNENARLAAMGLASGSGSAWDSSQDTLNRSANDANQKAVLGGFDAWNTSQTGLRNNMATMMNGQTSLLGQAPTQGAAQMGGLPGAGAAMVTAPNMAAAQMGQITANAPTNDLAGAMSADSATQQANNNQIAGVLGKAGGKAIDWWNQAGSSGGSMPANWSGDYYSNPNNDSYGF